MDTLPAPSLGPDIDEYVDAQGFRTTDVWLIYELYTNARWHTTLSSPERGSHFISNMSNHDMTIVEACYIWDQIVALPENLNIRQRWAI